MFEDIVSTSSTVAIKRKAVGAVASVAAHALIIGVFFLISVYGLKPAAEVKDEGIKMVIGNPVPQQARPAPQQQQQARPPTKRKTSAVVQPIKAPDKPPVPQDPEPPEPEPECGGPGQPPCPRACGGPGEPPCPPPCGGKDQPPCPPPCGGKNQPPCPPPCGGPGEPPCPPPCGGKNQPPCPPPCGGPGQPRCIVAEAKIENYVRTSSRPEYVGSCEPSIPSSLVSSLRGESGVILVLIRINETGEIDEVEITKSTLPQLNDAVRKFVKGNCKFQAPIIAGKPSKIEFSQPFRFEFN